MKAGLDVFLVAIEPSGDVLGAGLMQALRDAHGGHVAFRGLGGPQMVDAGLSTGGRHYDIPTIGVASVLLRLPTIARALYGTVAAIVAAPPDVLILIDSPDFTHRIASRVRRRLPRLPIVKYVSPTVWIWRPGRARAMRPSFDLILALLPFEPEVHRELGGPDCVYVGHPLLDRLVELRPSAEETRLRAGEPALVLALPGSRRHEIERLGALFGEALGTVAARRGALDVVLPTLPQLAAKLSELTARWPLRPRIVTSDADKYAAFRRARAALAASGTVTLELALSGIPTVAAYRVPLLEGAILRRFMLVHPAVKVASAILPNLVLGEHVVPEFLQRRATAANIAPALADVIEDTQTRRRQIEAFERLDTILGSGASRARAAAAVLDLVARGVAPR